MDPNDEQSLAQQYAQDYAAGPPAAAPVEPGSYLRQKAQTYGLRITSGQRTPAQNAAAGGAKRSYHLTGQALDVGGDPRQMRRFAQDVAADPQLKDQLREVFHDPLGGRFYVGGHSDHVHVAWGAPRKGAAPQPAANTADNNTPDAPELDDPQPVDVDAEEKQSEADSAAALAKQYAKDAAEEDAAKQLARQYAQESDKSAPPALPAVGPGSYSLGADGPPTARRAPRTAPQPKAPQQPAAPRQLPRDTVAGANTFNPFSWDNSGPVGQHAPGGALGSFLVRGAEAAQAMINPNVTEAHGAARQEYIRKAMAGEAPFLQLAADPAKKAQQVAEISRLRPYVDQFIQDATSRYIAPLGPLADHGNQPGQPYLQPNSPEFVQRLNSQREALIRQYMAQVSPENLKAFLQSKGVQLTPLQEMALPSIAAGERFKQATAGQATLGLAKDLILHLAAHGAGSVAEHLAAPLVARAGALLPEAVKDFGANPGVSAAAKLLHPGKAIGRYAGGGAFQGLNDLQYPNMTPQQRLLNMGATGTGAMVLGTGIEALFNAGGAAARALEKARAIEHGTPTPAPEAPVISPEADSVKQGAPEAPPVDGSVNNAPAAAQPAGLPLDLAELERQLLAEIRAAEQPKAPAQAPAPAAPPSTTGLTEAFSLGKNAVTDSFVRDAFDKISHGQKLPFADNPRTVEGKISAANLRGEIRSINDVARIVADHYAPPEAVDAPKVNLLTSEPAAKPAPIPTEPRTPHERAAAIPESPAGVGETVPGGVPEAPLRDDGGRATGDGAGTGSVREGLPQHAGAPEPGEVAAPADAPTHTILRDPVGERLRLPDGHELTYEETADLADLAALMEDRGHVAGHGSVPDLMAEIGPERFSRAADLLDHPGALDGAHAILDAREGDLAGQLQQGMQQHAQDQRETGQDAAGLLDKVRQVGHRDRFGNWEVGESLTDDELNRIHEHLNTPGRQTAFGQREKLYQNAGGRMSLESLIKDARTIPGDAFNDALGEQNKVRAVAKRARGKQAGDVVKLEANGEERTHALTEDQAKAWNEADQRHRTQIERADKAAKTDKEYAAKVRKTAAMERSAERRRITGHLTTKEAAAAAREAKVLRPGDTVAVDGKRGTVAKPAAFGRVAVDFEDGTSGSHPHAEITKEAAKPTAKADAFLADLEEKTRASIKEHGGRLTSGVDPELMAKYAALGGIKIARGAIRFADWADHVRQDLPHLSDEDLKRVWAKAKIYYSENLAPRLGEHAPKPETAPHEQAAAPKNSAPKAEESTPKSAASSTPKEKAPRTPTPAEQALIDARKGPTPEPTGERYAANINLDHAKTPEDVRRLLLETADQRAAQIETQRRGTITHDDLQQMSRQLGLTEKQARNISPGEALSAEKLLALRELTLKLAKEVENARKDYKVSPTNGNLVALTAAIRKYQAVHLSLTGATAEAGRALNQFKVLAEARRSNPGKMVEDTFRPIPDEPKPAAAQAPEWGKANRLFTEERANAARQRLKDKLGRLNSGVDPTLLADLVEVGGFHLEAGLRSYGAWRKAMLDELGDGAKPHLQEVWNQLRAAAEERAKERVKSQAKAEGADVKDAGEVALDRVMKQLGEKADLEHLAESLAKVDTSDPFALNDWMRKQAKFKPADYLHAYQVANLLSGVSGTLKHALGAVTFDLTDHLAVRPLRAALDVPISRIQKRAPYYHGAEVPAAISGWVAGAGQGFQKAADVMLHGMERDAAARMEFPHHAELPGGAANPFNLPSRTRSALDALGRSMAENGELAAGAVRQAKAEGLKGEAFRRRVRDITANPDLVDGLRERVEAYGDFANFQGDMHGGTDPGLKNLSKWVNTQIPEGKLGEGLRPLRLFLPFLRVPYYIVKRGFEFTPGGYVGALADARVRNSPELSDRFARATLGTAAMLPMLAYAQQGGITGPAPASPADKAAWQRLGRQPWSIKLGGKWVDYRAWGPLGFPLIAAAAFARKHERDGEEPDQVNVAEVIATLADGIEEHSFLSGLKRITDAVQDPQKEGQHLADSLVNGMIPFSSLLHNAENATDKTLRDTRGDAPPPAKGAWPAIWQAIQTSGGHALREVTAGTPGLAQRLPAKVDALGRDEERRPSRTGIGALSPAPISEERTDTVDRTLADYHVTVAPVRGAVRLDRQDYPLTTGERREYQQQVGAAIYQAVADLQAKPAWKRWDDERRKDELTQAIRDARMEAQASYKDQYAEAHGIKLPGRKHGGKGLGLGLSFRP